MTAKANILNVWCLDWNGRNPQEVGLVLMRSLRMNTGTQPYPFILFSYLQKLSSLLCYMSLPW